MKLRYCDKTGLLFADGVALTIDTIVKVNTMIDYSLENQNQFEFSVTIHDKINNAIIKLDNDSIKEILDFLIKNNLKLAENIDFM